jgi:hypothetical protein
MASTYVIYAENRRRSVRAYEIDRCRHERDANEKVRGYRCEYGRGWAVWWKKEQGP